MKNKNRNKVIKILKLSYISISLAIAIFALFYFYFTRNTNSVLSEDEIDSIVYMGAAIIPAALTAVYSVLYTTLPNKITHLVIFLATLLLGSFVVIQDKAQLTNYVVVGGLFSILSMVIAIIVSSCLVILSGVYQTFKKNGGKDILQDLRNFAGLCMVGYAYFYMVKAGYGLAKATFYLNNTHIFSNSVFAWLVFCLMLAVNSFDIFMMLRARYLYAQRKQKLEEKV